MIAMMLTAAALGAGPGHDRRTLAENRAAARADAKAMVKLVTLPSGAVLTPDGSAKPTPLLLTPDAAYAQTRWQIPGDTPAQVIAYVQAHPPAGASVDGSGSTSEAGVSSPYLTFSLADTLGIDGREIDVSATAATGGGSTVTVEAESVWFVPRSAASMIPAGARRILVRVSDAAGRAVRSATVSARSRVAATVRFYNRLEADQPFYLACPVQRGNGDTFTVSFYSPSQALLARAVYRDVEGGSSGGCSPVELTVGHRYRGAVYGGEYLPSLERLLDIRLPVG